MKKLFLTLLAIAVVGCSVYAACECGCKCKKCECQKCEKTVNKKSEIRLL